MGKRKKDLPPIAENPIFRELVEKLKGLPADRLEAFQEFAEKELSENGPTQLPQTRKKPKTPTG